MFRKALLSSSAILRCQEAKNLKTKTYPASNCQEIQQASTTGLENNRRIYVGNLLKGKEHTSEDKIFEYFSQFGKIDVLEFFREKVTKLPRGFAFVTFRDLESARQVIEEAQNGHHFIDGHKVRVEIPRLATERIVTKRSLAVLVDNVLKSTSKEELKKHFSQFGKVDRVIFAKEDVSDENKRSFYVMFTSVSGAREALQRPFQKVADQEIDSHISDISRADAQGSLTHIRRKNTCISVASVPSNLTVEDLRDYFQKYGDVQTVDFIVNGGLGSCNIGEVPSVAFLQFSGAVEINEILQIKDHVVSGSTVRVSLRERQPKITFEEHRKLKISVEGLPLSTGFLEVREYFDKTFNIVPNGVFIGNRKVLIHGKLVCIVRLSSIKEVEQVLQQQYGAFDGHPLYFRRLFWTKLENE